MGKEQKSESGLYTIGHSNHSIEKFISLLNFHNITYLVDVRTSPYSRWNPQFIKMILAKSLKKAGITYKWGGKYLGGLNGSSINNPHFIGTMEKVLAVAENENVAMMCSESKPEECHRAMKLTAWVHKETELDPHHITKNGLVSSRGLEAVMPQSWFWHEFGGDYK